MQHNASIRLESRLSIQLSEPRLRVMPTSLLQRRLLHRIHVESGLVPCIFYCPPLLHIYIKLQYYIRIMRCDNLYFIV